MQRFVRPLIIGLHITHVCIIMMRTWTYKGHRRPRSFNLQPALRASSQSRSLLSFLSLRSSHSASSRSLSTLTLSMASSTSKASASGSPFAQTLKAISQIKYSQLDKAHSSFKVHHNAALAIANDDTLDPREKVTQLIRETRRVSGQDPDAITKHWRDRRRKGVDWNEKDLPTKQSELLRVEAAASLAAHDRNVSAEQLAAHV